MYILKWNEYNMIDWRKFGISIGLWLVSLILGVIPVFANFIDWYLDNDKDKLSFIFHVVTTSDFYSCLMSILIVGLVELVLTTGNRHSMLIIINVICDSIILMTYNLSLFKVEFLIKMFKDDDCASCLFIVILTIGMIIISVSNIRFLSIIENKKIEIKTKSKSKVKVL